MSSTRRGKIALSLLKDPGKLLTSILLGNTFVNVAASSVAAGIVAELMPGTLGMGLGVLAMTFLLLVFGEISPKTIARSRNRQWIEKIAPFMVLLLRILSPAASLLKYPADAIDRFIPGKNRSDSFRETELNILMEMARREGFLGNEADIASAILELDQRSCVSAMIPRERVVYFISDWSISRMCIEAGKTEHTAYPLVDPETGGMTGLVDVRDLLGAGELIPREVPFFPEAARLNTVLAGLREAGGGIGAVVDEYGDWTGIISVNDVLERAVFAGIPGTPLPEGVTRSGKGFIVPGNLPLDILASLLETEKLEARYAESCGGFLQEITGSLPETDEIVKHQGFIFRVLETSGKSIQKILVEAGGEK